MLITYTDWNFTLITTVKSCTYPKVHSCCIIAKSTKHCTKKPWEVWRIALYSARILSLARKLHSQQNTALMQPFTLTFKVKL